MGRHNATKRNRRDILDGFDTEYREWPELPHIATITAMPLKTRFINSAAAPWANIDKVIFDVEELQAYLAMWAIW